MIIEVTQDRPAISEAHARLWCYLLGPFAAPLMLYASHYGALWSVRFHAFHSMLLGISGLAVWTALRLVETISPWFLAAVARETRFIATPLFLGVWVFLGVSAYRGSRFVIDPAIHQWAVRLARRYGKRFEPQPV